QWPRLLTSIFLHADILHLFFNMAALWVLGRMAERAWYRWEYILLYLLCGAGGSIAAVAFHPLGVTIGASGAIFGLMGALVIALMTRNVPLPGNGFRQLIFMLIFIAYSFYSTAGAKSVSIASHLAGLIVGLVLGAFLTIRRESMSWSAAF